MDKNAVLIELSERGRFWRVGFAELSGPEQVFRAIWELESDVNGGGFEQYYANSSGDTAFAAAGALAQIGAHNASRIVAAANAVFPGPAPPPDRAERQALLDALGHDQRALLESLGGELMDYPDDLTELLFEYVKKHAAEIDGATAMGL